MNATKIATYTLCIGTDEDTNTVEAIIRRAIPAGIDGPFTSPKMFAKETTISEVIAWAAGFGVIADPARVTMVSAYDGLSVEIVCTLA